MPSVGEVWIDDDFYGDKTKRKYLVIAAVDGGWVTYRLTTSKPHGRSTDPACYTGDPYPAFYLGQPSPFWRPTWLNLQALDDLDDYEFANHVKSGKFAKVGALVPLLLCEALRCMVSVGQRDITRRQRRVVGDAIAKLGCP